MRSRNANVSYVISDDDNDDDDDDGGDGDDDDVVEVRIPRDSDVESVVDLENDVQVQHTGTFADTARDSPIPAVPEMRTSAPRSSESLDIGPVRRRSPFIEFSSIRGRSPHRRDPQETFGGPRRFNPVQQPGDSFEWSRSRQHRVLANRDEDTDDAAAAADNDHDDDDVLGRLAVTPARERHHRSSFDRSVHRRGREEHVEEPGSFDPVEESCDSFDWTGSRPRRVVPDPNGMFGRIPATLAQERRRNSSLVSPKHRNEPQWLSSVPVLSGRPGAAKPYRIQEPSKTRAVRHPQASPMTREEYTRPDLSPRVTHRAVKRSESTTRKHQFTSPHEQGETPVWSNFPNRSGIAALPEEKPKASSSVFSIATERRAHEASASPRNNTVATPAQVLLNPGEVNEEPSPGVPFNDTALLPLPEGVSSQRSRRVQRSSSALPRVAQERVNSWPSRGALLGCRLPLFSSPKQSPTRDASPQSDKKAVDSGDVTIVRQEGNSPKVSPSPDSAVFSPMSNSVPKGSADVGRSSAAMSGTAVGTGRDGNASQRREDLAEKQAQKFVVKATCRYGWEGSVHVLTASYALQFEGFYRLLGDAFEMRVDFAICYFDDDGDPVTVSSDVEMEAMLQFVRRHAGRLRVNMKPPHGVMSSPS